MSSVKAIDTLDHLVRFVEAILALPSSSELLEARRAVEVYDSSGGSIWAEYHERVISEFKAGWRIEPDPARKNGYLFYKK